MNERRAVLQHATFKVYPSDAADAERLARREADAYFGPDNYTITEIDVMNIHTADGRTMAYSATVTAQGTPRPETTADERTSPYEDPAGSPG